MPVDPDIKPGIYRDISNDNYHAGPGISKSGLWTIYDQSPAHYKFPPERERDNNAFDFGTASHMAILEPDTFEFGVRRGPADRRGNKWKDLKEVADIDGAILLTEKDYDNVCAMAAEVHSNEFLHNLICHPNVMIEHSFYWRDPETGVLCRCRPDLYRPDLGIVLDVKSSRDVHPRQFPSSVVSYGYHAQEAFYSRGIAMCDMKTNGFVFLAQEKESPWAKGLFELPPSIVEEGGAIVSKALRAYAACVKTDEWPAYGDDVQELKFKRYHFRETPPPDGLDGDMA